MTEEAKIIFVFSGPRADATAAMKKLTKCAQELGWDLEERHIVSASTLISFFDTALVPPPPAMHPQREQSQPGIGARMFS